MLKRSLIHCGLAAMLLVTSSCLFDPEETTNDDGGNDDEVIQLKDLKQKENVLNNILYAYKYRKWQVYNDLLGDQFTFFFAEGDVGGEIPEQWNGEDEINATTKLFDSNLSDGSEYPICRSIRLDLELDNIQWQEVIPEGYPDETWYTTFIFYTFTFEMEPDQTWIAANGSRAQFTVRNVGTEAAPHWQLVEFRDLGTS
jgi:hypothetical protein